MSSDDHREKHCESQHFSADDKPSESWGLDRLTEYCKARHDFIAKAEKDLAATYWQLGMALTLAKRNFSRGQWLAYLKKHGIEPTRASKARAIYVTFPSVEKTSGLSVKHAYGQRSKTKPDTRKKRHFTDKVTAASLFAQLQQIKKEAQIMCREPCSATTEEASQLLLATEEAIDCLRRFGDRLRASVRCEISTD